MSAEEVEVSIVLPTLNEAGNIAPLLDGLFSVFGERCEIAVVDDDSKDGTPQEVVSYAEAHPRRRLSLLRRGGPPSLALSLQEGISRTVGTIVVWMDADGSMPPEDALRLVDRVKAGCDIAVGSRFIPGGGHLKTGQDSRDPAAAVWVSRLFNFLLRRLIGLGLTDYTSGFAAVRRAVIADLGLRGDYGEYFIDLVCRARGKGYSVVEIPYVIKPRRLGDSKTCSGPLQYARLGVGYALTAVRLRWSAGRRVRHRGPAEKKVL